MSGPSKLVSVIVPLIFYIVAALCLITGWQTVSLVFLVIGIVATLVGEYLQRQRAGGPIPQITPGQATELRDEKARNGEVAATKRLRAMYPQLSLIDAVRLVRGL